jgi:hypothetical protein
LNKFADKPAGTGNGSPATYYGGAFVLFLVYIGKVIIVFRAIYSFQIFEINFIIHAPFPPGTCYL